jgi:uncharacterized protein (UPF0332 family)
VTLVDQRELEGKGLIEPVQYGPGQIAANLARAARDLSTATATMPIDAEWAYAIAYHSMLRAGRALMFSKGWRPKERDQHKTVVEFCAGILGAEYQRLVLRFNRMRVRRNDFVYEPERPIPHIEAIQSLESAREFVERISAMIAGSGNVIQ